jgi:hypothetical protein
VLADPDGRARLDLITGPDPMLDILGAITVTAIYAAIVGVLIGFAPVRGSTRLVLLAAAAAWAALIAAAAALGGLAPGTTSPLPATLLPFTSILVGPFGSWVAFPRFRATLLSVTLEALIGLNASRLAGFFFLLLAVAGRLSAPFAPTAAWGDMTAAVAAVPPAAVTANGGGQRGGWRAALGLWNFFGAVDLIVAVSLGVLSAPGTPFRVSPRDRGHDDAAMGVHPGHDRALVSPDPLHHRDQAKGHPACGGPPGGGKPAERHMMVTGHWPPPMQTTGIVFHWPRAYDLLVRAFTFGRERAYRERQAELARPRSPGMIALAHAKARQARVSESRVGVLKPGGRLLVADFGGQVSRRRNPTPVTSAPTLFGLPAGPRRGLP